jgi:DNA-binding transcriptional regulator YhcF (GntR family)
MKTELLGDRELFSFRRAARVLGINRLTLRRAYDDGRLVVVEVGRNRKFIPRREILRMLDESR